MNSLDGLDSIRAMRSREPLPDVPCPWCGAEPMMRCIYKRNINMRRHELTGGASHPSRIARAGDG